MWVSFSHCIQNLLFQGIFLGDSYMYKNKRIPLWYLRLKLGTTLATLISLTLMGTLIYNAGDQLKTENDPLRKKSLPSDEEILSGTASKKNDILPLK